MTRIILASLALPAVAAAATLPVSMSWILMIFGFGAVGAVLRHRRAARTLAA